MQAYSSIRRFDAPESAMPYSASRRYKVFRLSPEVELLASEIGARLLTKPVDLEELYRAVLSRQPARARIAAGLGMNQALRSVSG